MSVCTEEQPSSAERHDAAAARLHKHLPSAENFLEKTSDEAEITSTSVNSRLSLLSATVSNANVMRTLSGSVVALIIRLRLARSIIQYYVTGYRGVVL